VRHWFSDVTRAGPSGMQAGHIRSYDPRTGVTSIFRSPRGMAYGIVFDANGDMIVAEGAGIRRPHRHVVPGGILRVIGPRPDTAWHWPLARGSAPTRSSA
jgi:sugar lactone lactonase YvrE